MIDWPCAGGRARGEGGTKLLRELVSKAQKKEDRAEALSPVLLLYEG